MFLLIFYLNTKYESYLADLDKIMHFLSKFLTSHQLKNKKHEEHDKHDKHKHAERDGRGHHDKHERPGHGHGHGKHPGKRGKIRLQGKQSAFGLKYNKYAYKSLQMFYLQLIISDLMAEFDTSDDSDDDDDANDWLFELQSLGGMIH